MLITRRIFCNHQLLHNFTTKKLRISSAISNILPIRFVLRKPLMQHRVQAKRLNSRLPCHTRRNPAVVVHLDAAVNNIFFYFVAVLSAIRTAFGAIDIETCHDTSLLADTRLCARFLAVRGRFTAF